MKNQRGITLISLIITIVVLIILAGVAISMTLGQNGIFNKAQEAKKMQAIAQANEKNRIRNINCANGSIRKR